MALARIKSWIAGDTLTAADLNGEFNNVLNHPISLVSPTTGVINFSLQAHTNLRLENFAVDPVSTSTGRMFFNTGGNYIGVDDAAGLLRQAPTLPTTAMAGGDLIQASTGNTWQRLAIGTTDQVLIGGATAATWSSAPSVASSALKGAVRTSAGGTGQDFSTITSGSLIYASSAGAFTSLGIGTSGQVLAVTTGLLPAWSPAAFTGKTLQTQAWLKGSSTGGILFNNNSTAYSDVDAANLKTTLIIPAGAVIDIIGVYGIATAVTNAGSIALLVDSTGATQATIWATINNTAQNPLGVYTKLAVLTTLSSGAHTFSLGAKTSDNANIVFANPTNDGASNAGATLPNLRILVYA